jgi:putative ABC transport system permease protein
MNRVALRIAFRELAGGLKGFWIYLACLALGATAIASAGSVTEVFNRGLTGEARMLLGGDLLFSTAQRRASAEERVFIDALGDTTETAGLDLMGTSDAKRQQVGIRAVDQNFPVLGSVTLSGGESDLQTALQPVISNDGETIWGAVVSKTFLEVFEVGMGDIVTIGPVQAKVTARLDALPDRLGTPGTFGPEAIIHLDALIAAERLTTGQIFRSGIRVLGTEALDDKQIETDFKEKFEQANMRVRGPDDAVDGLQNLLNMLNSFLAVIGIAALVAGGVGVAQATSSFLNTRLQSIAALKALGANAATIRSAYLFQLGSLAVLGSLIGVAIGAAAPYLLAAFAGDKIPLPQALAIYPTPLLKAFILGLLSAAVFALPAIGRARATPPSALFRMTADEERTPVPKLELIWAIIAAIVLALVAVLTSARPMMTLVLLGGAIASWVLFLGVAWIIRKIARIAARSAKGFWRLTLSNLGGPGSLAPTIVPALGLGLALLTLVASVQTNLLRQISETAPANAPSAIFSQIPNDGIETFDDIIAAEGIDLDDPDIFRRAPFLLARVTEIKDAPVNVENIAESERWVVRGETSLTYLAKKPPEAELTAGEWWSEDYDGPLLVSVEADAAKGLRLAIGDTLGFRVFGRDVTATVASFRTVNWGTFGIGANTAFIMSPGTLEAAKPYHVAIANTTPLQETNIIDALGKSLPEVVVFQTGPALETASKLFGDIAIAVNAAASVVTIAGLLVLFGAFAAMARKRQSEAALLKTFGAERRDVLRLYAGEFGLAGAAAAIIGCIIGVSAAYPIVVSVFEATWTFPWREALYVTGFAVLVSAVGGWGVGLATLKQPPIRVLRTA